MNMCLLYPLYDYLYLPSFLKMIIGLEVAGCNLSTSKVGAEGLLRIGGSLENIGNSSPPGILSKKMILRYLTQDNLFGSCIDLSWPSFS